MGGEKQVYVLAEAAADGGLTELSGEIIGLGIWLSGELGCGLNAVIIGSGTAGAQEALLAAGARKVFVADHEDLSRYEPESYLDVLSRLPFEEGEGIVLAGNTTSAQDLAPRFAALKRAGLVTDCVGISAGDGEPLYSKPVYGGNAVASLRISTPIEIATVRPRVGKPPEPSGVTGERVVIDVPDIEKRLDPGERIREDRSVGLDEAKVVVSGGRGMGGPEGFQSLAELAELLGGAVGASRPPCDSGWISSTCQVGITGKMVAPDLYVAVGLSGSSQHLSGMSESGKIVAINSDANAYIFKVSDYGAVGDWKKVLPAFVEAVRRSRESRGT